MAKLRGRYGHDHLGGLYAGRRVLVTGHTGFKGSWLVLWLRSLGAQVVGLALDPDTQPSHWAALQLADVADYRVDLRDAQAVNNVLQHHQPEDHLPFGSTALGAARLP